MRLSTLALLGLLALYALSFSGCEDDQIIPEDTCDYNFATVAVSGPQDCNPPGREIRNLRNATTATQPPYPAGGCGFGGRSFTVEAAIDGVDDEYVVQLYNAAPGTFRVRVYGATECDNRLTALTDCTEFPLTRTLRVPGTAGFTKLFIRAELFADNQTRPTDWLKVVVYSQLPSLPDIEYHPTQTNPSSETDLSCDGTSFNRIVVSTCNPDFDVKRWIRDLGGEIDECLDFPGGSVAAVVFPNGEGGNPREVARSANETKARVNDGGDAEIAPDLLFGGERNEGPYNPGPNDELSVEIIEGCLPPTVAREPRDGSRPVVITNIDTGVDLLGPIGGDFQRYPFLGKTAGRVRTGSLGWQYFYDKALEEDIPGHGTAVASEMLYRYAGQSDRGLSLVHLGIFGDNYQSNYYTCIVAVHAAVDLGSDVVNMSWGIPTDLELAALRCAVQRGSEQGIVMVASAGNDDVNIDRGEQPQYPASWAHDRDVGNLLSVGSFRAFGLRQNHQKADFSNFSGTRVSLCALRAARVWSVSDRDFVYRAGTSYSAPQVSRVAAVLVDRGLAADRVVSNILTSPALGQRSTNLTDVCRDERYLYVCATGNESP